MKDDELRFELVKLVHHQGREPHQIAERAEELLKYVKTGDRPLRDDEKQG